MSRVIAGVVCVGLLTLSLTIELARAESKTASEPRGQLVVKRFRDGGYDRRFRLYSPVNAQRLRGARPLVLVIHGGASTDRGMLKLDRGRWNTLADHHGFYVAYPNAVSRLWDFGEGKTSNDLKRRVDDLAYFRHVLTEVSREKPIDPRRIFATGISRGGQSSFFLACNLPNRIRAIMPVAMSLPTFMVNECTSGPPIGIAIMNGTADPQVPYEGGFIKVFRRTRDEVLSTNDTIALWRRRNGCEGISPSTREIDKPGDETSVSITEWSECDGAPVKLLRINNGGHTWPSGIQYLPARLVGETARDISASEEGWAFFSQFK
ncbi:MAG: PHB depolymerase family esterase [Pseudomonadota bacterium]